MLTPQEHRVRAIQDALRVAEIDGWLFYDFRHSDPLAYRVLQLDPARHVTRRWYYIVPAAAPPRKLLHRIEPHTLDELPGDSVLYVSWDEQRAHLQQLLAGTRRLAMQYSPLNAIPYVARVDAGTIELIRGFGIDVVSSADLVQRFEAILDDHQAASHRHATEALRRIVDETFRSIGERIAGGRRLTEYDVQQFILARIQAYGLVTASPPIAAVNGHSADPHYSPPPVGSAPVGPGDFILIDLWAKQPAPGSIYGDITWTGFIGERVPARHAEVFAIVRDARDAALQFVRDRVAAGAFPCGWEVDEVCRGVIRRAGHADRFLHRTGHSIGEEVHGNGANLDNLETQDGRRLLPNTCFSIEPGVYLPGEFGVRSELDVYLTASEAMVFGQPIQTEIVPILASPGGAAPARTG